MVGFSSYPNYGEIYQHHVAMAVKMLINRQWQIKARVMKPHIWPRGGRWRCALLDRRVFRNYGALVTHVGSGCTPELAYWNWLIGTK